MERPGSLLTEPAYRARLREATRTDWRFLLGLSPSDHVVTGGADAERLAHALAPWVRDVHGFDEHTGEAPDWVFLTGGATSAGPGGTQDDTLPRAFATLRPGGHLALALENRWGLHWLADWRTHRGGDAGRSGDASVETRGPARRPVRHGLRWHVDRLQRTGAERIGCYALLPSCDAPRAIIPIEPPCPPEAQKMALDQVWQRATPSAALMRRLLGLLVDTGLMHSLYPHYLLVGRKPC